MNAKFLCLTKFLIVLLCGSLYADQPSESSDTRVDVGNRPLTKFERLAMQEEHALRESESYVMEKISLEQKAFSLIHLGEVNRGTYYSSYSNIFHYPYAISFSGDTIEIEDGSIWSVNPSDRILTLDWLTSDPLIIALNHSWFSSYYYRMININTGAEVTVDLALGPLVNGRFTHWIVQMDKELRQIWLEDGSVWDMSWLDRNVIGRWLEGDAVILGINDGFFTSGNNPNIIINVNTDSFAIGKCVFQ